MSRLFKSIVLGLQIVLMGISSAVAQDTQITRADFEAFMRRSRDATKDITFRERVTGETSEFPVGSWKPYYVHVRESVYPDRYRLFIPGNPTLENIQIGNIGFSRKGADPWIRSEPGAPGIARP